MAVETFGLPKPKRARDAAVPVCERHEVRPTSIAEWDEPRWKRISWSSHMSGGGGERDMTLRLKIRANPSHSNQELRVRTAPGTSSAGPPVSSHEEHG